MPKTPPLPSEKIAPDQRVRLTRIEQPAEADPTSAALAVLMDSAFVIPGTKIRFGLDAVIGLFPGVGDAVGALISTILIARASAMGVPKIVLARMTGHVLINTVVGAIPIFGDAFSIFFRSNQKNYALLRRFAGGQRTSTARDWLFVAVLLLVVAASLVALAWGGFVLLGKLLHAIRGE